MGIVFDVICRERQDRFDLGKGEWWGLSLDNFRQDEQAFIDHVYEVFGRTWNLDRDWWAESGRAYVEDFASELWEWCRQRDWKVELLNDADDAPEDIHDYWQWPETGTRYRHGGRRT